MPKVQNASDIAAQLGFADEVSRVELWLEEMQDGKRPRKDWSDSTAVGFGRTGRESPRSLGAYDTEWSHAEPIPG
jgi:hypothetical protein